MLPLFNTSYCLILQEVFWLKTLTNEENAGFEIVHIFISKVFKRITTLDIEFYEDLIELS